MNIFQFSAGVEAAFERFLSECNNPRERKFTFTADFAIAMVCENNGDKNAITKTYREFTRNWKTNQAAMTELVFSLNWLAWFCHENQQFPQYQKFTPLFSQLYYNSIDVAEKNLKEDEYLKLMRDID